MRTSKPEVEDDHSNNFPVISRQASVQYHHHRYQTYRPRTHVPADGRCTRTSCHGFGVEDMHDVARGKTIDVTNPSRRL